MIGKYKLRLFALSVAAVSSCTCIFATLYFSSSNYFRGAKSLLDEVTVELGVVAPGERSTKTVEFRNSTSQDLVVKSIRSTCTCTIGSLSTKQICPGDSSVLEVASVAPKKIGPATSVLRIWFRNGKQVKIVVKSVVLEASGVYPRLLEASHGSTTSFIVYDRDGTLAPPQVTCDSMAVQIESVNNKPGAIRGVKECWEVVLDLKRAMLPIGSTTVPVDIRFSNLHGARLHHQCFVTVERRSALSVHPQTVSVIATAGQTVGIRIKVVCADARLRDYEWQVKSSEFRVVQWKWCERSGKTGLLDVRFLPPLTEPYFSGRIHLVTQDENTQNSVNVVGMVSQ